MPRVKLTEHKSKTLLFNQMSVPYHGIAVTIDSQKNIYSSTPLSKLLSKKKYVVKVDQGVKGRMKKGLVQLRVTSDELVSIVCTLVKKGYTQFIIEEMLPHDESDERYISIERVREGVLCRYSKHGGIDIESNISSVKEVVITDKTIPSVAKEVGVDPSFITQLREFCEKNYVSFLEINPLVVRSTPAILDLAVEVDSTASFFVKDGWNPEDIIAERTQSLEESKIAALNAKSQAAMSFTLLNPNGSIWCLLSGGGASITIADEFYNLGHGNDLGNYGEYSGNPTQGETYTYTKYVLDAMLKSNNKKLMILIGGGVANFTDIRATFAGVLQAFEEYKDRLKKRKVKIFTRRGGPYQKEGLKMLSDWATQNGLYGYVSGPDLPLHEIVKKVVQELIIES